MAMYPAPRDGAFTGLDCRTECIVADVAVTKDRGAAYKDFRTQEEATTSRRAFEANSAGCGFDRIGWSW
jgi:hypothetical protein